MIGTWTLRMAWRESRGSRRRLLVFLSSMVVGVALLVALSSTSDSLQYSVDEQARALLGADMRFSLSRPFSDVTKAAIDTIGIEQAERISILSVAYFPAQGQARLSGIHAAEGKYPFYGSLKTDPVEAASQFRNGSGALVDQGLMRMLGVAVGDTVQVGRHKYAITGSLVGAPGESEISMIVMPSIYVPLESLDSLLLGVGAMANYEVYVKLAPGEDSEEIRDSLERAMTETNKLIIELPHGDAEEARASVSNSSSEFKVNIDTAAEQRENWEEALDFFSKFLGLAGFGALILGGLGVGGAIKAHVRRCFNNIAVLQCLGAGSGGVFAVYFVQAFMLGCIAGVLGCFGGALSQMLIPYALSSFLPFEIAFRISWSSMAMGFGVGLTVTLIFAILPLLDVRGVSPLRALRSSIEPLTPARIRLLAYLAIVGGLIVTAALQSGSWVASAYYALAITVALGALLLVAKLLMLLARRITNRIPFYPLRQGLANLHRPGNQTVLVMIALGLGTFIVMVLLISESIITGQIDRVGGEGRPDMIFFDIQEDQLAGVTELIEEHSWSIVDSSPIVNMRLHTVGDQTVEEIVQDSSREITWSLVREYRSTYRAQLTDAEELVSGTFTGVHNPDSAYVQISIEEDFARNELLAEIGDTLIFDVQGMQVPTTVASFREVDWEQMRSNFYVVFPTNVLEEAPQTHIISSRRGEGTTSDSLQGAIAASYPSVTALSLETIVRIIREVLDRIGFAIQFMAYFCFAAGILVLIGALLIGRLQRIEEYGLLKTLGGSRRQLLIIALTEYFVLGLLSSATGLILSLAAGWVLSVTVFDIPLRISGQSILLVTTVVIALTVTVGFLSSRSIYEQSTLSVLRAEG